LVVAKHVGVSKKFSLLDVAASSHARTMGATATRTARVPAFDNLGDDLSPDVREARVSAAFGISCLSCLQYLVNFCALASQFLPWALITSFADPVQLAASLDLLLESIDEDLEYSLHRISFVLPPHFSTIVLILIDLFILQALALSEKQCEKRVAESA
jgi:hypothetical protein